MNRNDVLEVETVTVVAPPLVRIKLYPVMLLTAAGAFQVKVMSVVPIRATLRDVGGSGVGGAISSNK